MIRKQMRFYDYAIYCNKNAYGESVAPTQPVGQIEMAINVYNQSVGNTVLYSEAEYIALTHDENINDKYIIFFGNEKLKVKYVNNFGRYTQVYLTRM